MLKVTSYHLLHFHKGKNHPTVGLFLLQMDDDVILGLDFLEAKHGALDIKNGTLSLNVSLGAKLKPQSLGPL